MSTYTVFWSIDVELKSGASIEDHARHAAEICRSMNFDDPEDANVFHVAVHDGGAARLLEGSVGSLHQDPFSTPPATTAKTAVCFRSRRPAPAIFRSRWR